VALGGRSTWLSGAARHETAWETLYVRGDIDGADLGEGIRVMLEGKSFRLIGRPTDGANCSRVKKNADGILEAPHSCVGFS